MARDLGIAIVTRHYQPGEILPGELAASQRLKISRAAYREAVRMLAAKGLVEPRRKAGTSVAPRAQWNLLDPDVLNWTLENNPDQEFLDELFELRMVVEPAAAALAARRRSTPHLEEIAAALHEMGLHETDSPANQEADKRFHAAVLLAGGNEMLTRLASIIAASVGYVAEYKRERHVCRDPLPDHAALYAAIEAQKPSDARKIMMRLIEHARDDTAPE